MGVQMRTPLGLYIPEDTVIHKLNSFTKLLGFLLLLIASIAAENLTLYSLMLGILLLLTKLSKLKASHLISPSKHLWSFFLFIFLMNATLSGKGEAFFSYLCFSLSKESLAYAFGSIFHIVLAIYLAGIYTSTSSPVEITEALKRLLKPLAFLKVPTAEAASILTIALQFIPTLSEESSQLIKAQRARGADIQKGSLLSRAKDALPLILPIFLSAFRKADDLALAMEARGYRGENHRSTRKPKPLMKRDYLALIAAGAFLALVIIIRRSQL